MLRFILTLAINLLLLSVLTIDTFVTCCID